MSAKSLVGGAMLVLGVTVSVTSHAEIEVRALARALSPDAPLPDRAVLDASSLSAVIEMGEGEDGAAWGLPRIGSHFSAVRASLTDLDLLAQLHPSWRVTWSAPLHPLVDRAAGWARATSYRSTTGFAGKDVIVGIVDTGIDPEHRDFRNADGTTRIAYLIDFSQDPLGKFPDEEAQCTQAKLKCAVLSAADIDAANKGGQGGTLPGDAYGHGTHVASLAAGNGGREGKYVGIAPEATLIIASASSGSDGITDAGVLVSTSLVFSLAEKEGQKRGLDRLPAVVNLSLGSDWGPHDGSTALERGLADMVTDDHPGRAIVVAAGNSAGVFSGSKTFPNPLGIHTDVSVPERETVRVPIALPPAPPNASNLTASMLVWLDFRPDDDISVGLERAGGTFIAPQRPGAGGTFGTKPLGATIVNGALGNLPFGIKTANAAAIVIQGTFPATDTFTILLEGHGTARLWMQSEGDLGPGSSLGALFPGATKESTIAIPAASPGLIAVGATLNRTTWIDRVGDLQRVPSLGSIANPPLDTVAYFSSAGPTSDLRMKPDLVAPGAFVVGAMSHEADPSINKTSVFTENPSICTPLADCIAVDDSHAVTLGTSMASPIVAGAVALLFGADPTLTESRIRTLLQAGARHPEGLVPLGAQLGAGALDLTGVLDVMRQMKTPVPERTPVMAQSWLALGATYAHPDPTFAVPAVLELRDASGRPTAIDPKKLAITIGEGAVTTSLDDAVPGMVRFSVAANGDTGGETLTVEARYDGALVAEQSLPIAVDVNVVRAGFTARGGCALSPGTAARDRGGATASIAMLAGVSVLGRLRAASRARRRRRVARTARNPGRTGTSGRGRRGSRPR